MLTKVQQITQQMGHISLGLGPTSIYRVYFSEIQRL